MCLFVIEKKRNGPMSATLSGLSVGRGLQVGPAPTPAAASAWEARRKQASHFSLGNEEDKDDLRHSG